MSKPQLCANCAHMSRKENDQQRGGRRYGYCDYPIPWWVSGLDSGCLYRLIENIDVSGYDCVCYKEAESDTTEERQLQSVIRAGRARAGGLWVIRQFAYVYFPDATLRFIDQYDLETPSGKHYSYTSMRGALIGLGKRAAAMERKDKDNE